MLTRRYFAHLAALAWLALSSAVTFAQVPPPVPALPDTERRTQYSISATTCACSVGFQLYQDSTDVDQWAQVYINGTRYLSTDPVFGWKITSNTGTLSTIPRPIVDGVLTFNAVQTGTVQIVGAQRPRRLTEVAENRGVAARDFNQFANGVTAQLREGWDFRSRLIFAEPGFVFNQLPIAAVRASQFLCFDSNGQITTCTAIVPPGGPSNTFAAGTGIVFTGINPTTISSTPLVAGPGIVYSAPTISTSPGVNSNVLRTAVANDTILTTDCGKTIQLGTGSTGFFSETFPSVAGFSGVCSVILINSDTTNGKKIAGLTGITMLWPLQSLTAKIVNGAWAIVIRPPLWSSTSPIVFWISGAGLDTSDCLTQATACLTPSQAMTNAAQNVFNIGGVTLQWFNGTYTNVGFVAQTVAGPGSVTLAGAVPGSPGSVSIVCNAGCPGAGMLSLFNVTGNWIIKSLTLSGTQAIPGIYAVGGGLNVTYSDMLFGSILNSDHIFCSFQTQMANGGSYTISGPAIQHAEAEDGCSLHITVGVVTLTGTPAFTTFLGAHGAGAIIGTDNTHFSGGATGVRCAVSLLALIDAAGTGASLPGGSGCAHGATADLAYIN